MSATDYTSGLAAHFSRMEAEERESLFEATRTYWQGVRTAADGGGEPTADEAQALVKAMALLGDQYTVEGFSKDVGELQHLRDLRAASDVEAATEEKEKLTARWTEALARVAEVKKELASLEQEAARVGAQSFQIVPAASEKRRQADALAEGMRQHGAGVLSECSVQPHQNRPMARCRTGTRLHPRLSVGADEQSRARPAVRR